MASKSYPGITDEYSNYNLTRSMLGVGGVLGFGAIAGAGILSLNNSAFIKAIARGFEDPKGYKPFNGSTISTGTSFNRSALVAESLRHTMNLGVSRHQAELDRYAAMHISKKGGFLDRVVAQNEERIKKQELKDIQNIQAFAEESRIQSKYNEDARDFYRPRPDATLQRNKVSSKSSLENAFGKNPNNTFLIRDENYLEYIRKNVLHELETAGILNTKSEMFRKTLEKTTNIKTIQDMISYVAPNKDELSKRLDIITNKKNVILDKLYSESKHLDLIIPDVEAGKNATVAFNHGSYIEKLKADLLKLNTEHQVISDKISASENLDFFQNHYGRSIDPKKIPAKYKKDFADLNEITNRLQKSYKRMDARLRNISIQSDSALAELYNATLTSVSNKDITRRHTDLIQKITGSIRDMTDSGNFSGIGDLIDELDETARGFRFIKGLQEAGINPEGFNSIRGILDNIREVYSTVQNESTDELNRQLNILQNNNIISKKVAENIRKKYQIITKEKYTLQVGSNVTKVPFTKIEINPNLNLFELQDEFAKLATIVNATNLSNDFTDDTYQRKLVRNAVKKSDRQKDARINEEMFEIAEAQHKNRQALAPQKFPVLPSPIPIDKTFDKFNTPTREFTVGESKVFSASTDDWQKSFESHSSRVAQNTLKRMENHSGGGHYLLQTYKSIQRDLIAGKSKVRNYHPLGIASGVLGDPHKAFHETAIPKLKQLINTLKEAVGASDVNLSFKELDFTNMEITLVPIVNGQKSIPVRIAMPVNVGSAYFKGKNLLGSQVLYTVNDAGVRMKNMFGHMWDQIISRAERIKSGDAQTAAYELDNLNRQIDGIRGSIFGKGGKFGLGQLLDGLSGSETRRVITTAINIDLTKNNDSQYKKSLRKKKALIEQEWHRHVAHGTASTRVLQELKRHGAYLDRKIRAMGNDITKSMNILYNVAHANQFIIADEVFTMDDFIKFSNIIGPDAATIGPQAMLEKGAFSLDRRSVYLGAQDMARGTKKYAMVADTYEGISRRFEFINAGYNLEEGMSISRHAQMHEILRFKQGRKRFEKSLSARTKDPLFIEYKKNLRHSTDMWHDLKAIQKGIGKIKPGMTAAEIEKLSENSVKGIIGTIKKYQEELNKINKTPDKPGIKKMIQDIQERISYQRKRIELYKEAFRSKREISAKVFVDLSRKINFNQYSIEVARGEMHGLRLLQIAENIPSFNNKDLTAIRELYLQNAYHSLPGSDIYLGRDTITNHYSRMFTRSEIAAAASDGLMKLEAGGIKAVESIAESSGLVPLKMWLTGGVAELAEGAAFLSRSGANRLGLVMDRGQQLKGAKVGHLISAVENLRPNSKNIKVYNKFKIFLSEVAEGKINLNKEMKLENIANHLQLKGKDVFYLNEMMNEVINKTGKLSGFIKKLHGEEVKWGKSTALFEGLTLNSNGTVNINYTFIRSTDVRSKVADIFSGKYTVHAILEDSEMLLRQRKSVLSTMSDALKKHNGPSDLSTFVSKQLNGDVTDSSWKELTQLLSAKGVNNTAFKPVAKSFLAMSEKLMSTEQAAEFLGTNRLLLKGQHTTTLSRKIVQTTVNNVMGFKGVQEILKKGTAQGNEFVNGLFTDIFNMFLKKDVANTHLINLGSTAGSVSVGTTLSTEEVDNFIINMFDSKSEHGQIKNRFDNLKVNMNKKIKKAISQGIISTDEGHKIQVDLHKKLGQVIAQYDPVANRLNNVEVIGELMNTTESMFDLQTVSGKRYNALSGFSKGAKISLFDSMMLKVMGFSKFHSHIMEHALHGREFLDNYTGSMLDMLGLDPSELLSKQYNKRSQLVRAGQTQAKLYQGILKAKIDAAVIDPNTGIKTLISKDPYGLLGITGQTNQYGNFLKKVRLELDDLKELEGKYGGDQFKKLIGQMENAAKESGQKIYYEMDVKKLRSMFTRDEDFHKMLSHASSKMNLEEAGEMQKFLRQYKGLQFDPDHTRFQLFNYKHRKVNTIKFTKFGWEEDISKLVNIETGSVSKTGDIGIMTKNNIVFTENSDGSVVSKSEDFISLNDVHKAQSTIIRMATTGNISEDVLNQAYNNYADNLAHFVRNTGHDMMNKRLPSTVRGIGLARSNIRLDRLNSWKILEHMNEQLHLGVSDVMNIEKGKVRNILFDALNKNATNKDGKTARNIFQDFLKADGSGFAPGVGEVFMDQRDFQESLEGVMKADKAKSITRRVAQGQEAWMSMGVRYPTIYSTNIAPLMTNLYEGDLMLNLHKYGVGDKDNEFQNFIKASSSASHNTYINAIEAKLRGGDFDRDQYAFINALSSGNMALQNEMKEKLVEHSKFTYKYEDRNGNSVMIIEGANDRSKIGYKAKSVVEALKEAGEKDNVITIENGNYVVVGKKEKDIIAKALTFDEITSHYKFNKDSKSKLAGALGNVDPIKDNVHTKFLVDRISYKDDNLGIRNSILEFTKKSNSILTMSDTEIEAYAKKKGMTIDALIQDEKHLADVQMKSHARLMRNLGMSENFIEDHIQVLHEAMAMGMDAKDIIAQKYAKKLDSLIAPLVGVKATTGIVTNVGQYVITNAAMSVTKDANKILAIKQWSGDAIQASISSKHGIPITTDDFISSVYKVMDPNASNYDRMQAEKRIRTGEYKAKISRTEISDLFQTNKVIGNLKDRLLTDKEKSAFATINEIASSKLDSAGGLYERSGITNIEWLKFQESKKTLASNNSIRSALKMTSEDIGELERSIKGIEKGRDLLAKDAGHFLDVSGHIRDMARMHGIDNITKLSSYKIFGSNRDPETSAIVDEVVSMARGRKFLAGDQMQQGYIMPELNERIGKTRTGSYFHTESIGASTSRRMSEKIGKGLRNMGADAFVDTAKFASTGMGALLGMAAIGFVGMFAIQSNRRDWLGPTPGTGGEYAEHSTRKDEENLKRMTVSNRLGAMNVKMPFLHMQRAKDVRLMGENLGPDRRPSKIERLRQLNSPEMIDEPMQFKL